MLGLVGAVPQRRVGESHAAHGRRLVDGQPDFDGGVLLDGPPARRQLARQAAGQRLARILTQVAVLAGHLRDEVVGRLALGLGVNAVVQLQQA